MKFVLLIKHILHINALWLLLCLYLESLSTPLPFWFPPPSSSQSLPAPEENGKTGNRKLEEEKLQRCVRFMSASPSWFTDSPNLDGEPTIRTESTCYFPEKQWVLGSRSVRWSLTELPIQPLCHLDLRLRLFCKQRTLDILRVFSHTCSFNCAVPVSTESNTT